MCIESNPLFEFWNPQFAITYIHKLRDRKAILPTFALKLGMFGPATKKIPKGSIKIPQRGLKRLTVNRKKPFIPYPL